MEIQFLRAAGEVTGSCYLIHCGGHTVMLECGQIQGDPEAEELNRTPFAVSPREVDAVILSHAHIDHSGRLPLLVKEGYAGRIHTHHASRELCDIMLRDSAFLHERDAEHENRKRARKGQPDIEPLFTREHAQMALRCFQGHEYGERITLFPGIEFRLQDAGHILGAAIVEIWLEEHGTKRKIVFSGDLGHDHGPVMAKPEIVHDADVVMLESTYGDRNHLAPEDTIEELRTVFRTAEETHGNIIIPAFAVGRTQDLLHLMSQHFDDWQLKNWQVFLDSPMAIEATDVYSRFRHLYSTRLFQPGRSVPLLRNLAMSRTPEDSMAINRMDSGAVVIAGSGMCTGGRVLHHLKHNLWRSECHVVIVGYQANGTLGRRLVDGTEYIKIWGETIRVNAQIHTVGGLSAHADQRGLLAWYEAFHGNPPVWLVHGEADAQAKLAGILRRDYQTTVKIPELGDRLRLQDRPGTNT